MIVNCLFIFNYQESNSCHISTSIPSKECSLEFSVSISSTSYFRDCIVSGHSQITKHTYFGCPQHERQRATSTINGRICLACVPLEHMEQLQCGVRGRRTGGSISGRQDTRVPAAVRAVRRRSCGPFGVLSGRARASAGQNLQCRLQR